MFFYFYFYLNVRNFFVFQGARVRAPTEDQYRCPAVRLHGRHRQGWQGGRPHSRTLRHRQAWSITYLILNISATFTLDVILYYFVISLSPSCGKIIFCFCFTAASLYDAVSNCQKNVIKLFYTFPDYLFHLWHCVRHFIRRMYRRANPNHVDQQSWIRYATHPARTRTQTVYVLVLAFVHGCLHWEYFAT